MNKPKVFFEKTTDRFRVWNKSVKTYFQYEKKIFTVDSDKIDWLGGRFKVKALF
jgi:hypothetical protein